MNEHILSELHGGRVKRFIQGCADLLLDKVVPILECCVFGHRRGIGDVRLYIISENSECGQDVPVQRD